MRPGPDKPGSLGRRSDVHGGTPRVLHLVPSSGLNPWLLDVVASCRPEIEPWVASLAGRGPLHNACDRIGVPAVALGATSWPGLVRAAFQLLSYVRRNRIDIVHTHLMRPGIAAFLARLFGLR